MKYLLAACLLVSMALPAQALIYTGSTSRHDYLVDVRDQYYRDVYGLSLVVQENSLYSATLIVQGFGIQPGYATISLNPYARQVTVFLTVTSYLPVSHAHPRVPRPAGDKHVPVHPMDPRDAARAKNFQQLHSAH